MSLYFHPHIDDPMFNESFNKFEFEYKSNGAILKPWSNQFPNPIKYSTKRDIWFRGHQYEFKLFDGKVIVSNSSIYDSWKIYYSHHNIDTEKNMKDLSFNAPKEMDGSLNSISFDITTCVKFQDETGYRPNWGLILNCIYLELSNESWIYIRKDHPLITNQIDNNKIRNLGIEIYYMCDQPFNWFKINTEDFPIRSDKWFSFWGGKDYRN